MPLPSAPAIDLEALFAVDEDWLALDEAPVFRPDLPIIDAHHHAWDHLYPYLLPQLTADMPAGHRMLGSVCVECGAMYRPGDGALAPVGETEGLLNLSRAAPRAGPRFAAGIVGFADLTRGAAIAPLLEAHCAAGEGRFRGVRFGTPWDADPALGSTPAPLPPHLLTDGGVREALACLLPLGFSFDAWVYHPQLPDLIELARSLPDLPIIVNHYGGPLGLNAYADRAGVLRDWGASMRMLADCPNVFVKMSGLSMHLFGFGFESGPRPPSADQLVTAWRPYVETVVGTFGPDRAMFGSNFPVDKRAVSYRSHWNACKRLALEMGAPEALLWGTANRVYRLGLSADGDGCPA